MNVPTLARVLGYAGLLPFFVLAAGALDSETHKPEMLQALTFYGAVIAAFMGALHWAYALVAPWRDAARAPTVLLWSVVPALVAWAALVWLPSVAPYLIAAALFAQWIADRLIKDEPWFPPWFWQLRGHLTAGAVFALVVAGAFS
jgi:Protein of unknown function (DUF3429)